MIHGTFFGRITNTRIKPKSDEQNKTNKYQLPTIGLLPTYFRFRIDLLIGTQMGRIWSGNQKRKKNKSIDQLKFN